MVEYYPSIHEEHADFIREQSMFFIASAPLAGRHVNLSLEGHLARSFAILDANTVAYVDATDSGCETISHVYENGRITVMFCSFSALPEIMRLFCIGRIVESDDRGYEELKASMGCDVEFTGARAIVVLKVSKVQTSCGFGPLVEGLFSGSEGGKNDLESGFSKRDAMRVWPPKVLEQDMMLGWQQECSFKSLDGLTGLRSARRACGEWMMLEDFEAWQRRVGHQWDTLLVGMLIMTTGMWALHALGLLTVEVKNFGR